MGDVRYREPLAKVRAAEDRAAAVRDLSDDDVVSALAASAEENDPLLSNVLATEAHNRMRRARTVYQSLGEGVVMTDATGRITLLNPPARRILRASDEDVGRDLHEAVHAFCVQPSCALKRALDTGQAVEEDESFLTGFDGSIIPAAYTVTTFRREALVEGLLLVVRTTASRRAEAEATRAAEVRTKRVLDAIAEGVMLVDVSGTITYANDATARILGASADDIEGRKFYDPIWELREADGSPLPVREMPILAALRDRAPVVSDGIQMRRQDGVRVVVRMSVRPLQDPLDRVDAVVVSFADVTERSRQEAATSQLAAIVEGSTDPIIGEDLDGKITTWNPAAARLYGYAADEAVGRHISILFPEGGAEDEGPLIAAIRGGDAVEPRESYRVAKDGRKLRVRITAAPVHDRKGRVVGIAKIHHDLTAAQRAEERARLLLDAAPDGFVVANEEGRVVMANAQAERMFGWTRGELLGMEVETLMPETYRRRHAVHRDEYMREPRLRPMGVGLELWGEHRDGTRFPIEISLSPVRMDEGLLVVASVRDMRERSATEEPAAAGVAHGP